MLSQYTELVLDELMRSLRQIDTAQLGRLVEELLRPRRILCVGVGRVLISMKAWVKRMAHFCIDINYVGSETEGPLETGDLLIAASSSGESVFPVSIARIAKQKGAMVVYVGCTKGSTIAELADFCVLLPGKTKFAKSGEFQSRQPMSTLFEQQLYLLCDILALEIMDLEDRTEADIKRRHANLE